MTSFNSLMLSEAYNHHQPRPSLVQIMACCLFGAKPLSEPTLLLSIGPLGTNICQLAFQIQTFSFIWKCHLVNVSVAQKISQHLDVSASMCISIKAMVFSNLKVSGWVVFFLVSIFQGLINSSGNHDTLWVQLESSQGIYPIGKLLAHWGQEKMDDILQITFSD